MRSLLKRLFGRSGPAMESAPVDPFVPGRDTIVRAGDTALDLLRHATLREGLPHPHWQAVHAWIATLPDAARRAAWSDCERTWLRWLGAALGPPYRLYESDATRVLTPQPPRTAATTLAYVDTAQRRVRRLLEELARPPDLGKEILVVFADHDAYYRYVGHYYPEEGEFAMSSGMHLDDGCGHFVTCDADLHAMEPVIVHEMTHSCVGHLPLPAWLNEGMAVNAEARIAHVQRDGWSLHEMHARHRAYWTPALIQEFWSGRSYLRTDAGNELSYDLGRILVDGLSHDWSAFKRFASTAHAGDAGAAAARAALHVDLGEFVRGLLDGDPDAPWGPQPAQWAQAPERGGFRRGALTHLPSDCDARHGLYRKM